MRNHALALVPFVLAGSLGAQSFDLDIPNIMLGPEHVGEEPSLVRWTDDGRWVYFRWKPGGVAWHEELSFYRVPARGGTPERVTDQHMDSVGVFLAGGDMSRDRRWKVVAHDDDLWLIDRRRNDARRLTDTREAERAPVLSPDARTVYFIRDDNLFALGVEGGSLRQLTDIRRGRASEDEEAEGRERFLEEQQLELFEHLRIEAARRERRDSLREAREAGRASPVRIGREERVTGIMVSPTERWALVQVTRPADSATQTMVPAFVTASGYTEPLNVRAKVGDDQSSARVGLVDVATGEVAWLDLAPATDVAVDSVGLPTGDHPALANVQLRGWNRDGTLGLVGATSYDFRHRWIHVVDGATGELRTVAHDYDPAWIGGPCWTCADWMPDGSGVWFVSERDGHAHLYTVATEGGEVRQLTSGAWEVHDVAVSVDERRFRLRTNEGSPFEYHVYEMPLAGGARTRITTEPGVFDAVVPSPEGDRLAVVHSYSNRPGELFVMPNRRGADMTRVTHSPTEAWLSFDWVDPDIIRFPARDGALVPARIYRPADLGASPNGAAVIFVHGAGYLQNVHRGWSSYYREYMFHHLLAARGYTVLDIDFRASRGYGRDWRTDIYRHMGGKDLSDQVDGVRYLVEHEGVSADRVGIYGGSYGGFITLMALFTEPDRFAAGAALRAVTDWAHYNHNYTNRILNRPQEDDEAYRRSSPIYFAEGLRAPLLITHGMVDTNVHFQDVVRLAQRLIELGKTDWEMALYPVENHGFVAPSSWADQYRRIFELFEGSLHPVPAAAEAAGSAGEGG